MIAPFLSWLICLLELNLQEPGAKPKFMVQSSVDDPPTFHDAIVKMLFKVTFH